MHFLKQPFLIFIPVAFLLGSCSNIDVFEKNIVIPNYHWSSNFIARGDFIISDTSAAYNLYIIVRHTDAYAYNNIWISAGLQQPGESMLLQKINLSLGDDRTGWEGIGMNDIWETRKLIGRLPKMKKGTYRFQLGQIMRDDPLLHVMSVGLRIEKAS